MNSNKLVVISCVGSKIWDSNLGSPLYVPAQDAYVSTYFLAMKNYAIMTGFPWLIFSAKYGFLEPDHPICDYNVEMGKDGGISQETISAQVLHQSRLFQGQSVLLKDFKQVCIIAAKAYARPIKIAYGLTKVAIYEPMKGCPIGVRISRLQNAVRARTLLCNEMKVGRDTDIVNESDNHTDDEEKGEFQQNKPSLGEIHENQGAAGGVEAGDILFPPPTDFHGGGVSEIREWVWKNVLEPKYRNLPLTLRAGDINAHLKLKQQMPQVCGALRKMHEYHPVLCDEQRGPGVQVNSSNVWFTYSRPVP